MAVFTGVSRRNGGFASFVRVCALCVAGMGVLGFVAMPTRAALAQADAAAKTNIDDTWQGTLHGQKDLRSVVKISKGPDGALKGVFYTLDQAGGRPFPIKTTTFQGGELKLTIEEFDGTFVGKMSPDGTTITGEWKQGDKAQPLILLRTTTETAWAIPEPPAKVPPMAADADPSFEVATIKLTPPEQQGKGFGGPPRHFETRGTTLNDLISFAYSVSMKQIAGGPAWRETDKFDIVTQPDLPGAPSADQTKSMMRKLLESRFGMKFHQEKREMSAYVLSVAKGGPKLTKSEGDPHAGSSFFFTKIQNPTSLVVRNASMRDFANGLQGAVFDRPVIDQTGLQGRWDCSLKWTPDESQFVIFNIKIVPPDAADAPPAIFTAIQEQIGLKLDAGKPMVDVMVLDHVEKPSEN